MKFLYGTVLTFLFLFSSAGWSQADLPGSPDNASHKVQEPKLNLRSFKKLTGQFVQNKVLSELKVEIKTEGHFMVQRNAGGGSVFHWNVEKPKPSQVCLDKNGIIMNSAGTTKKIAFSEISEDSSKQMSSLLNLMSSDPNQLASSFKVKEFAKGRFLLTPLKPEEVFFQTAELRINEKKLVDKITLFEKSKDELQIQFSNLKADSSDKDSNRKSCDL